MSQIETVIRASKQLEQLLEQHYGAIGRGLHEKTSSIEVQLDNDTVRRLRKIATLRNKVVHEDFELDDLTDFQCDAQALAQQLQPQRQTPAQPTRQRQATKPSAAQSSAIQSTTAKPNTTSSRLRPAKPTNNLATKTPTPRAQPRVQPSRHPTKSRLKPTRPTVTKTDPLTPRQPISAYLPTISGLLVFVAIIWILAH